MLTVVPAAQAATGVAVNVSSIPAEESFTVSMTSTFDMSGVYYDYRRVGAATWIELGPHQWSTMSRSHSFPMSIDTPGQYEFRVRATRRYVSYGCGQTGCVTWEIDVSPTTATINVTAPLPKVTAIAPTVNVGSFTVPTVAGLTYQFRGPGATSWTAVPEAGVTGRQVYEVRAQAQSGYKLVGTSTFSADTREPVSFPEPVGTGGHIAAVAHPGYTLKAGRRADGTFQPPSTLPATGVVTPGVWRVSATENAGYRVTGTSSYDVDAREVIATVAPDLVGHVLTIPTHPDLTYTLNGEPVAAGTTHRVIAATVNAEFRLPDAQKALGDTTWTFEPGRMTVQTAVPTAGPLTIEVDVPEGARYEYRAGTTAPWRLLPTDGRVGGGVFEVRALAEDDSFVLSGDTSWTSLDTRLRAAAVVPPVLDRDERTVVIPEVDGIEYLVDGIVVEAGTHDLLTKSVITARLLDDYVWSLSEPPSWNVDHRRPVTLVPPSADRTARTLTIPHVSGVEYRIDGTPVTDAGPRALRTTATVTARLVDTETTVWSEEPPSTRWDFDNRVRISPPGPGTDVDRLEMTIPSVPGVEYLAGLHVLEPRVYTQLTAIDIHARLTNADESVFTDDATTSWRIDMGGQVDVEPPKPELDERTGKVTIPVVAGVAYSIGSTPVSPGTHTLPAEAQVAVSAASASLRYRVTGTSHWMYDGRRLVEVAAPTFDAEAQSMVIPSAPGVIYAAVRPGDDLQAQPEVVELAPGPQPAVGLFVVYAIPADETYRLSDTSMGPWLVSHFTVPVTVTAPTADLGGRRVTIPETPGVQYKIDGVLVGPGEHAYRTLVEVTAHATGPGFVLNGDDRWTFDLRTRTPVPAPVVNAASSTITLTVTAGIVYVVNGVELTGGTHLVRLPATVLLKVVDPSIAVTGTASWRFAAPAGYIAPPKAESPSKPAAALKAVKAKKPKFRKKKGRLVLTRTTGVTYKVRVKAKGKKAKTVTVRFTGRTKVIRIKRGERAVVTATALRGHKISGAKKWTFRR
ncbi:hypothetical protein NP095_08405 [Aeromicrobium duanguangcaii]|uniref:Uncharacterized protein n=1 Tax=Aeromicrobium duanguangcaii TaxID=2968086 RepID=A0ABY5K9W1_9ACTN|nr:hypothetical protein [Aeromicrobium duanguangcaii]UUI67232.1 hypothetical protein NP095_08405 [Aeromicrobium duanguangcaii]